MAGRFSVEAVFKAVDRVTAPVSRMQKRVGRFTRSMNRNFKSLDRTVTTFGNGLKRVAQGAVVALGLLSGAMANVVGTGAAFEQSLVNAAAKFPGAIRRGTEAFDQLDAAARRTGSTTEFTATQAAEALNFLAMAGFSADAAIAALPGVVDLATTAQIDLATASDIATDSLGAFNMLTKDAEQNQKNLTRITDVFAKATTSANLSVTQMFEAIKDGGPVGIAAGQSLETIATFAAKMADAGIKGTRAATGLKNIFLALNAPGSQAAKIMRRLGIQTVDASGEIRDAVAVFEDFSRATKKLAGQQRLQVFDAIFGKIPIAAAINLTNAAGSMRDFRKELEDATGTSEVMAGVMRDTLQGRLNSLTSAIEGVKISLFSLTNGPLSDAIERTTEWVRANEEVIALKFGEVLAQLINNFDEIVQRVRQVAGFIAAFVALSVAIKLAMAATVIFKGVMFAFGVVVGTVRGIMAAYFALVIGLPKALALARTALLAFNLIMFANPVGLVVASIAALVAIAAAVILAWEPVTQFFADLWGKIQQVVGGVGAAVGKFGEVFGFTAPDAEQDEQTGADAQQSAPQIISPQERIARQIDEQRTTNNAEVLLTATPGTSAEVVGGRLGGGVAVANSGGL